LIGEELEFRTGQTEGEPTFVWRDLDGDVDEFFEFIASGTNPPTQAFFETCMYRAMYERKYKESADATQDSDLKEFIWQLVNAILLLNPTHIYSGPQNQSLPKENLHRKENLSRRCLNLQQMLNSIRA
jgi:hypothetical protein